MQNSALEIEAFDNERELITYAENLLTTDTGLVVRPFSIGDNNPSSFQFGYSIGFLFKRYDTIAIYIFHIMDPCSQTEKRKLLTGLDGDGLIQYDKNYEWL